MKEKIIPGLITVRTSSSRLPSKCLLPFGDGNVLQHVIRRAIFFDIEPIVCTSTDVSDDIIENIASGESVKCFRGSLVNKLKRWSDCADRYGLQVFHTVDADDPFFDGKEIARSMKMLRDEDLDMVCPTKSSSSGGASVGYSLTAEIVRRVSNSLREETDTEMMWYYIEKIPDLRKKILDEKSSRPLSLRLTLDYPEDYWLLDSVRRILGSYATKIEIENLFEINPDLYKINWFRNEEWQVGQASKKI
jgi:spore coat polysaccharide biosynthesis protein SpsF